MFFLFPISSNAQETEEDVEILFGSGELSMDTSFSELISSAEEQGQVRIIVNLDVDFEPEGTLFDEPAIEDQREIIRAAQDELLDELTGFLDEIDSIPYQFNYIPSIAMTVDSATLEFLQSSELVSDITEDVAVFPALARSVPVINADKAWLLGYSGQGQTIAILDTGVESSHTMFSGKVVEEACYSTTFASQDSTTICPDGSGEQIGPGAAEPCTGICSHGSHVAGIAAGSEILSGPVSYQGVAKDANIIAIQVFSQFNTRAQCDPLNRGWPTPCVKSYRSDQMKGLERVFDLRGSYDISSVNLSLGGGQYFSPCDTVSPDYKNIIDQLRSVGIASIIASGNDGYTNAISFPACISTAISVGATDNNDNVASFSNSDDFLDLLAPGVEIRSAIPGDSLGYKSGTSMATPHVAGAWAVMKSKVPGATVDEVLQVLKNNGTAVKDGRNGLIFPRIDVEKSVITIPEFYVAPLILLVALSSVIILLMRKNSKLALSQI